MTVRQVKSKASRPGAFSWAGFLRVFGIARNQGTSMITTDYHTHNSRCGHAQGQIEDYIKMALVRGFTEIGISDHAPIYWQDGNDPMPGIAMAKDELGGYVDEVLALKTKYAGQIEVRLGLESDYVEDMEPFYAELLTSYPFDYVIGSVHFCLGQNIFNPRAWDTVSDPMTVYTEYYRLVEKSARSGLFNIIAHPTGVTAYAPKPIPAAIEPLQDSLLHAMRESDVTLEVNTSGYRKAGSEPFPTVRMITRAHELGVPLTFSSDAHTPDQIGYGRDKVEAIFGELCLTETASFANRQRIMLPLALAEPCG
jgi:histidinol-phosphatase (PHP family)